MNDRAADIWEPLFVLADVAGGEWPTKARDAAVGLTALAQEESPIVSLLLDLWILFAQEGFAGNGATPKPKGGSRIFSRDLVAALNASVDRPWVALRKGKEVTELWAIPAVAPLRNQAKDLVDWGNGSERVTWRMT